MALHRIVNCAEPVDDNDVVTLSGLRAYYRKNAALDLGGH